MATDSNSVAKKLTKEQYELLLFCEQSYWRTGDIPTYSNLVEQGINLAEEVYDEAWINPKFISSLRSRGIPEHVLSSESNSEGAFRGRLLTEQQLIVANVLLDPLDKRSKLKKLTELGVTTAEYNAWLKQPRFRQYCLDRAEGALIEAQPSAHMSLIERVSQGDLGAIKYFNSMTGRYRERTSAGVEVNVQNNYGSDMLIQIVEVIQRHVKDPEVLAAIGDEILALTNRNQQGIPEFRDKAVIEGRAVGYGI